jgi:arylsulfatase A-like enzyme
MPRACLLSLLALGLLSPPLWAANQKPPNIIILLADDVGYGDLSCYGHPTIRTPHLDRMAMEGMRFTQFYVAASLCTPSRAALLTGRLPIRSGLNRVLNPDSNGGIPASEISIADALKKQGYATACVGKWHLGHLAPFRPLRHGFDSYYGLFYSNDMTPVGLYRDNTEFENPINQATLTERYTNEALAFIHGNLRSGRPQPFFLYLAYTMPHVPLAVSKRFAGHSKRGLYGDVIEAIDWSVGEILQTLRDEHLAENTFVFFSSDNGPWLSKGECAGSAGLLREGKGSAWEGGFREPGIAWWPGQIPPGVVTTELAATLDLFPTCLTIAGADLPRDRPLDGKSLLPVLRGTGPGPRTTMFYYIDMDLMAIRKGPWKAHFMTQTEFDVKHRQAYWPPLLYHLEHDPSEQHNVADEFPEVVADLVQERERHQREIIPGIPQH